MNRLRYIGAVVLTALVLIFALQNLDAVPVDFLMWEVRASVALIALVPLLIGVGLGGAAAYMRGRARRRALTKEATDAGDQPLLPDKGGEPPLPRAP